MLVVDDTVIDTAVDDSHQVRGFNAADQQKLNEAFRQRQRAKGDKPGQHDVDARQIDPKLPLMRNPPPVRMGEPMTASRLQELHESRRRQGNGRAK